jgi:hypothetical protein
LTKSAAIVGAVNNAVLACLVLLGVFDLSGDQLAGISVAVNAVLVLVAAFLDPKIPFGVKS